MNVTERLRARVEARSAPLIQAPALPSLPYFGGGGGVTATQLQAATDSASVDISARFQKRMELAAEREDPAQYAEITRVCRLPMVGPLTPEEHEAFCLTNVLADQLARGWRLWPIQSDAVLTYEIYGGLFAPIGVGWGKTLISLMIAEKAFRKGRKKSLLLVPASVYPQLVNSNIPWARTKVPLSVPFHYMGGKSMPERRMIARSGRIGCYILPYSMLSTEDTITVDHEIGLLEAIAAETVIGDEIHYLSNRGARRTKRMLNWMIETQPEHCCMSGTITQKSVRDYHHLMKAALGRNAPLPLSPQLASEWGQVLDADAFFTDGMTGPIRPLVDWARAHFPGTDFAFDRSGFRKAYQLRLVTAPGVVSTGDSEIKTSLVMTNRPVLQPEKREGWAKLTDLITTVVDLFETPNGDEIEHRIHAHKWLKELTAGFYNELIWPTPEMIAKKLGCDDDEAQEHLARALTHHEAKQVYAKKLRKWLNAHDIPGADTPMTVGASMARDGAKVVGHELYQLWSAMKELEYEGMPERYGRAVRVCDYKVDAAIKWAKKQSEGALMWYQHQEIGEWLAELAAAEGLDYLHCPAGKSSNLALDLDQNPQNASKLLICSISAHWEGKNLQPMGPTYFCEWNQSAKYSEQVLGRNHRNGQMRDELAPVTCFTTDFDVMSFASTLNDALYIQQTMGTRQKLIYCGYDPMPPVFPPEILRERGFQLKQLSAEQRGLLEERFGCYKRKTT